MTDSSCGEDERAAKLLASPPKKTTSGVRIGADGLPSNVEQEALEAQLKRVHRTRRPRQLAQDVLVV